jgi:RNA polymerase sigma-70 factor, ECF subfamily
MRGPRWVAPRKHQSRPLGLQVLIAADVECPASSHEVSKSQGPSSPEASSLLIAWREGDDSALNKLIPLVYRELRYLARRYMRGEHRGYSLQTTDLVNEAYLRLVNQREGRPEHRSQFLAVAATMMRRILVDRARKRRFLKRGGAAVRVALDDSALASPGRPDQIIALDDALQLLERHDKRRSTVVELRFFGGLTVEETADVLGVSPITIKRDWAMAKAWLYRAMTHARGSGRSTS